MNSDNATPSDLDFDALDRKYEEERAKRLRPDAVQQYQELAGKFASFDRDHYADPEFNREPILEETDVVIVGGGLAGLLAGAFLREEGVEAIRIVEKGGNFGGTWYWNRYPGVACDVESYIYMPLLEKTGYIPTEKYAKGEEILGHCQRIARHFDLDRAGIFQTEATRLRWDEQRARWIVHTSRNDEIAARFVISCTGLLSKPKLPGIPGIESFEGKSFHTSRWDYDYTKGDQFGGLEGLKDKAVGIIGTGSTGIQCVPHTAPWVKQLYVFQRTPSSIDTRDNRSTDEVWAKAQKPGWQRERMDNFTRLTSGMPQAVDMVADSWTNILGEPTAVTGGGGDSQVDPEALRQGEIAKMEKVRQRVEAIVKDKATAEALKPYYYYFCKRPGFSDEYLQAFNRPNVTLVDTAGLGVERITAKGVVVAGKEYPVDCLIYATGFDFMTEYSRESGLDIVGRGGQSLSDHWATGARTLYGMQTRGFPNFFLMSLIQAGIAINYVHIAEEQTQHIAHIIGQCLKRGIATVEPTQEAEDEWVGQIVALSGPRRQFLENCIPGYYNYEGKRREAFELNEPYGGGAVAYLDILRNWRDEGRLSGLELRYVEQLA